MLPNDRQLQLKTRLIATRDVKAYRATIPELLTIEDNVLEIGCEWGTTTRLLAHYAGQVRATDLSTQCIEDARRKHPDLTFDVLDAFDLAKVAQLGTDCSVIYIDVSGLSGFRSLLDVLALVNSYAALLPVRAIVIKSGALVNLARRLEVRS